jgi:hypothetical protein
MKWHLSLGIYPGIVLGIRSYYYEDSSVDHVLYLPFVDIVLSLRSNETEE